MSSWLLGAVTFAYLYTGVEQAAKGNPSMALVFIAYAAANVGLIWGGIK